MKTFYLDFETEGLGYTAGILGLAYALDKEEPQYLPNSSEIEFAAEVKNLIPQDAWIVIHNAQFDLTILDRLGVYYNPKLVVCTMICSYLLWPLRDGGHSLDNLSKTLEHPKGNFNHEALLGDGRTRLQRAFDPELISYAKQDIYALRDVWAWLSPQMADITEKHPNFGKMFKEEMSYCMFLKRCHANGYQLNMAKLPDAFEQTHQMRKAVESEILAKYPIVPGTGVTYHYVRKDERGVGYKRKKVVDPISGKPLKNGKEFLYETTYEFCELEYTNVASIDHKFRLLQAVGWSPSNPKKPSTAAEELEPYAEEDSERGRLCAAILEYQRLAKLDATYLNNFMERSTPEGILRGDFNQCVTKTGRLSSSNPNLQNLPRKGAAGDIVRGLVIAYPGCKFASVDLDQIEFRVLSDEIARDTRDTKLLQPFLDGVDVHAYNRDKWKLGTGDKGREIAKGVAYTVIFGGGPVVAGRGDYKAGKQRLEKFHKENPAYDLWRDRFLKQCRQDGGEFYTRFGRRFIIPGLSSSDDFMRARAERIAVSCKIQGTAADIFKILTNAAYPQWDEWNTIYHGPVHDEVTYSIPSDGWEDCVLYDIKQTLYSPPGGLLLCAVESKAKIGHNWKECH